MDYSIIGNHIGEGHYTRILGISLSEVFLLGGGISFLTFSSVELDFFGIECDDEISKLSLNTFSIIAPNRLIGQPNFFALIWILFIH